MSPSDNDPQSEHALQDYLDDLFGESVPHNDPNKSLTAGLRKDAAPSRKSIEPTQTQVLKTFAEPPVRVLVRPLPPAAPPVVAVAPPVVAAPTPVAAATPIVEVSKPITTVSDVTQKQPLASKSPETSTELSPAAQRLATRRLSSTQLPEAPVASVAEKLDAPVVTESQPVAVPPNLWADNGRPHWAQARFECLMFKVGGLLLAVPLVDLGTIQKLNDSVTPIFGQADWFMGLMPVNHVNMRVVNTAKIVMPERYSPEILAGYRYVITLFDSHWGLAADSVAESITLQPDQVRWRTQRAKRGWLAGTVVDHMCALLDVGALKELLTSADRVRSH